MYIAKVVFFSYLLCLFPVVSTVQTESEFIILNGRDRNHPIQILKKGMCLVHPRNCPGGFKKRDAPQDNTELVEDNLQIQTRSETIKTSNIRRILDILHGIEKETRNQYKSVPLYSNDESYDLIDDMES